MVKEIFAIFDLKAQAFLTPFFSENVNTAMRSLESTANSPESFLGMYPNDYEVYRLGEFHVDNGTIVPADVKKYTFRISDLVKKQPEVKTHEKK